MTTIPGLTQSSDPLTALPMRLVRHRPLTPSEIQAIWVLLNPVSLPCKTQEIHITLTEDSEAPRFGWVIQLGQYPRPVETPQVSIPYD